MKIEELRCPSCGAAINMDTKNQKMIYCPFCGKQFFLDDGSRVYTYNVNINQKYTDEAELERIRAHDREKARKYNEDRRYWIGGIAFFIICISMLLGIGAYEKIVEMHESSVGNIQVGVASSKAVGKNYQGIAVQLQEMGFTNIKIIDLNDAGFFNDDTIESISIGGRSEFYSTDYFAPDSKIVISVH